MKTKLFTCLILVLLTLSCATIKKSNSGIIGTWELSSYQYGENERLTVPNGVHRIKLITPTHFSWIHFYDFDKMVTSSAGGRISFDGKNYIESIDFAGLGMKSYLGKEQKFIIEVEDGKLHLSGQLSDSLKIDEIWTKLK
jgi:hypothetical protein